MRTCACGCGADVPPGTGPNERIYATKACGQRVSRRRPHVRAHRNAYRRRRRREDLGRTCRWCGDTDAVAPWSKSVNECSRCKRQRARRSCGLCDGPFYARPSKRGELGCPSCSELTEYDRLRLRAAKEASHG